MSLPKRISTKAQNLRCKTWTKFVSYALHVVFLNSEQLITISEFSFYLIPCKSYHGSDSLIVFMKTNFSSVNPQRCARNLSFSPAPFPLSLLIVVSIKLFGYNCVRLL
jgi:hypothetical protein